MRSKLVEAEVDRDIFRKSLSLYKEFLEFVRNNGCLNHQVISSANSGGQSSVCVRLKVENHAAKQQFSMSNVGMRSPDPA